MRSYFAYHLLLIFLFGSLVPGKAQEELAKLPVLLQHYGEHDAQSPGNTFFQYLQLHYGNQFAQHRPEHDHSGLPMKSSVSHAPAPALADLPAIGAVHFQLRPTVENTPIYIDQNYFFLSLPGIWQPPKPCGPFILPI